MHVNGERHAFCGSDHVAEMNSLLDKPISSFSRQISATKENTLQLRQGFNIDIALTHVFDNSGSVRIFI